MIISLNWLKKFTNITMPIDELATLIGARLVEIEEVIDIGAKYKDVLVVRAVEVNALENSDHLNVVKIDDGGVTEGIERDENGLIQVVCGASNIASGQAVAWLPPKSIVPSTYYTNDKFVLDVRKLRGVISNGMIASAKELDLFDDQSGILVLDSDLDPGTSFAKAYELDDYLLDIANKSLTHRPDCFGIIGFAREVAAIQGNTFKTPEWLRGLLSGGEYDGSKNLEVFIDDPDLSSRYQAVVMTGVDSSKQSPLWVQTYLARIGLRPINAVVDITNYLMVLTGQPLHAFDYDKFISVSGGRNDIHVRVGREGEKLELLDGKTIELTNDDIVISAGDTAVALAGAMGGISTLIDENTKNIIIESATFNLYKLRSTQMRHGIYSEAITRFTKGQPAELLAPVLKDAINLMSEWADAKCDSKIAETYPVKQEEVEIEISPSNINEVLGSDFDEKDIVDTLNNVEFEVSMVDDKIKTKAPFWRTDIHIVEDIIEEVGRLNGFDSINPVLPTRDFNAISPNSFDIFCSNLRDILVRGGANEILTYSFVHGDILQKAGQDVNNSYKITNSISPDLQYCRQTITPSLLGHVHQNIKQGYDEFALFEVNRSHSKHDGINEEGVPVESERLALVYANNNGEVGAPYYRAKQIFEYMSNVLGVKLDYQVIDKSSIDPTTAPFEHRHSANIVDTNTDKIVGIVGEYKRSVVKGFKLPEYSAGFEFNTRALYEIVKNLENPYMPLSRYPSSDRDVCFKVSYDTKYSQIIETIQKAIKDIKLNVEVSPVDIYKAENTDTKNITVRIKLTSHDHTLASDEINETINTISEKVISDVQATVV